jgi:hypothetical protein
MIQEERSLRLKRKRQTPSQKMTLLNVDLLHKDVTPPSEVDRIQKKPFQRANCL